MQSGPETSSARCGRPGPQRDGTGAGCGRAPLEEIHEVKRARPGRAADRVNLAVPGAGLSLGRRAGSRPGARGASQRPVC